MKYEYKFRKLSEELIRMRPQIEDTLGLYIVKMIKIYSKLVELEVENYPISLRAIDAIYKSLPNNPRDVKYDCEVIVDAMSCIRIIVRKTENGEMKGNKSFTYVVSKYEKQMSIIDFIKGAKLDDKDIKMISERFINHILYSDQYGLEYISEV